MDDTVPYGLILRSLQGVGSDLEARQLRRWLEADPEHARIYQELVIWSMQAAKHPGPPLPADAVAEVLRRSAAQLEARDSPATRIRTKVGWARRGWPVAAATAAAVALFTWSLAHRSAKPAPARV